MRSPIRSRTALTLGLIAASVLTAGLPESTTSASHGGPVLAGRAVLPVDTYALGPQSGAYYTGPANGITFPTPSQPVEGFSAVLTGRRPGEFLAMPDNGFGSKANSKDFLIRAYWIRPDFETRRGGTGSVAVGDFISFRDPNRLIGFPIENEATTDRLLTGADIDPESMQRGRNGDYWIGDEFGPWILHFSRDGVLLDPPFAAPGGLMSPNNPFLGGTAATQPNSRGFEAIAITPDGRRLYAVLEGATVADAGTPARLVFEFDTRHERFTGRTWRYRTDDPSFMVADVGALDRHRLVAIERDGGSGLNALHRTVTVVDLRVTDAAGDLVKSTVVDLAAIPDPALISLPAIHEGDVGLGDPFRVTCESIEAIRVLGGDRLLLGCDNNFPNLGRNPGLADDTELIVVRVPALRNR